MKNIIRFFWFCFLLLRSSSILFMILKVENSKNQKTKKVLSRILGRQLVLLLPRLGPAFVKLGQVFSTRPDIIGHELCKELSKLHDKVPPCSYKIIHNILINCNLHHIFQSIEQTAVAAASVAQVHKATMLDGQYVAIKILRPGIENLFQNNLSLLRFIAHVLTRLFSEARRLKLIEIIDTVEQIAKTELDLRLEAAAADKLRHNSSNDHGVRIPKILWQYTKKHVLVMEWVEGIPIHDKESLIKASIDLNVVAANLATAFFNQAYRDGFFHADLHPGNIFVDSQHNIVFVDFGIVGVLDHKNRIFVAEIIKCFIERDYDRVAAIHFHAGYVPQEQSLNLFALACRSIGEPIIGQPAASISIASLLLQLFEITRQFNMSTQLQLLLLQKTMVTVEGIGQSLNPNINMWLLITPWIKQWAKQNLGISGALKTLYMDAKAVSKRITTILSQVEQMLNNK